MKTKTDFYKEERRLTALAIQELTEIVKNLPTQAYIWIDEDNQYDFDSTEVPEVIAYPKWSGDAATYYISSVSWNEHEDGTGYLSIRGFIREGCEYDDNESIPTELFVSPLEIAEIIEKIPE